MIAYDFTLFAVEKRVGASWVSIEAASVSYAAAYDPDANGVLIIGSEGVTVSYSVWGTATLLAALDVIRVSYDGNTIGTFTVDAVSATTTVDPEACRYGETVRTDLTASAVGTYASAADTMVSWTTALPNELPITRIRRWLTVLGWPT